jgi:hypothetical protein
VDAALTQGKDRRGDFEALGRFLMRLNMRLYVRLARGSRTIPAMTGNRKTCGGRQLRNRNLVRNATHAARRKNAGRSAADERGWTQMEKKEFLIYLCESVSICFDEHSRVVGTFPRIERANSKQCAILRHLHYPVVGADDVLCNWGATIHAIGGPGRSAGGAARNWKCLGDMPLLVFSFARCAADAARGKIESERYAE